MNYSIPEAPDDNLSSSSSFEPVPSSSSSSVTPGSDNNVTEIEELMKNSSSIPYTNSTGDVESSRSQISQYDHFTSSRVLHSIEADSKAIAANLDEILRDLRGTLHGMSDLTVESSGCYAETIAATCDSADAAVKNTYALLAKVEELGDAMNNVRKLAQHTKEIKQIVDSFEVQFVSGTL